MLLSNDNDDSLLATPQQELAVWRALRWWLKALGEEDEGSPSIAARAFIGRYFVNYHAFKKCDEKLDAALVSHPRSTNKSVYSSHTHTHTQVEKLTASSPIDVDDVFNTVFPETSTELPAVVTLSVFAVHSRYSTATATL